MKSMRWAITIFALTGALAALNLSGANHALGWPLSARTSTQKTHASSALIASAASTDPTEKAADNDDEDAGDGELVKTFLVTPRQPPAANDLAPELRYD